MGPQTNKGQKKQKKQKGGSISSFYNSFHTGIYGFFNKLTGTDPNDDEWRKCILKYSVMTGVLIGISAIILNIINNPGSASYNVQKYFFFIVFPLIMIFAIILNINRDTNSAYSFIKIFGIVSIIIVAIYYYSQSTGNNVIYSVFTNYIVLGLIIAIGLGISYNAVVSYMEHLEGWPGFIAQMIFYIPCILWDLWLYIFEQFKLTPYAIYAFIILEVLLVVLYFYLPNISNSITGLNDGQQLLTGVVYLNQGKQTIASSDILKVTPTNQQILSGNVASVYRTNYCISMWVYINPQNPSKTAYNQESEIFNYGFTDASGVQHVKPMIRYYGGGGLNDQLVERDKFVFYFSKYPPTNQYDTPNDTFYDMTLPNQKWNQIVFNYNRNIVDLFINGALERSFDMGTVMTLPEEVVVSSPSPSPGSSPSPSTILEPVSVLPVYNDLDNITIGSGDGLEGAICNIQYFNHPLSADQIAFSYNTLMSSNPPVPRNPGKTITIQPN